MHAIFSHLVEKEGLEEQFYIDSFGISPSFIGSDMTSSMQKLLESKGIRFHHKAQIFEDSHFELFDHIVVATEEIKEILIKRAPPNKRGAIHLLTEFCDKLKGQDIPDPYLKSENGYQIVFEILEEACLAFFDKMAHSR